MSTANVPLACDAGTAKPWFGAAAAALLKDRWAVLGLFALLLLALMALFAPGLFPGDPLSSVGPALLKPGANGQFPLGTDTLGRDVLAGVAHGARVSLSIGILATLFSVVLGVSVGVIAGYAGGVMDEVLSRITELFQTTPSFLLAIVIVSLAGPSVGMIVLAIGLGNFPTFARLARAEFRQLRHADFVVAAHSQGYGNARIVFQEILPNTLPPVIVTATVQTASAILTESGLSFLGLGDPNAVSWGSMIGNGREMLQSAWYLTAIPGGMIILAILAFNMLGDGLNEAFNPRLRKSP
ncbi:peptide/nickel transport system permease protein [Lampropedia hyalina DSM 16112]|jgi:peptide/nickel transport system permease protein|uniref:Peptide/nickel transport system permease protein n=1 Tax=Lampropedia hyalina DSM 16112 TaxID=1122156 RepID=A0A1M4SMU4_9BURK|nr:ABC transporter permease [Lampropedia hyalina]SHE33525.1 peptide/nickel transport system permease protein [Lampropedia hyalina DSM 16112]